MIVRNDIVKSVNSIKASSGALRNLADKAWAALCVNEMDELLGYLSLASEQVEILRLKIKRVAPQVNRFIDDKEVRKC